MTHIFGRSSFKFVYKCSDNNKITEILRVGVERNITANLRQKSFIKAAVYD